MSFGNTEGKGEIAHNKQFLLFCQCFLPIWLTLFYFHQIFYCRLQTLSVWKSLKFDIWERVKQSTEQNDEHAENQAKSKISNQPVQIVQAELG